MVGGFKRHSALPQFGFRFGRIDQYCTERLATNEWQCGWVRQERIVGNDDQVRASNRSSLVSPSLLETLAGIGFLVIGLWFLLVKYL